jgi:hypothetical protein
MRQDDRGPTASAAGGAGADGADLSTAARFVIIGQTVAGTAFRPSDWAERLAGVMAAFRPKKGGQQHLTYSPYVLPSMYGGHRCVIVDARLREVEPMAFKFLVNFAKDNGLRTEALPPEP